MEACPFAFIRPTLIEASIGVFVKLYCQTPDLTKWKPFIGKSGRLYIRVVVWSVVCHAGDSSDVTLAFEDAKGIPPFSREETDILDLA